MNAVWRFLMWFVGSFIGGIVLQEIFSNNAVTSFILALIIGTLAIKNGDY